MCGRYTLRTPPAELAQFFGLLREPDVRPRFNIAPTQQVLAVRFDEAAAPREPVLLRWGLVPFWADDLKIGNRMINARSDTVAAKPAFRASFKRRRCLVLADGFFEWRQLDSGKQPYHIRLKSDEPFAFAGLWEHWNKGQTPVDSCTIITTDANDFMSSIHDRMPVILPPDSYDLWLDPHNQDAPALTALLRPYADDDLTAVPVSTIVNNPRNDLPACVQPLTAD